MPNSKRSEVTDTIKAKFKFSFFETIRKTFTPQKKVCDRLPCCLRKNYATWRSRRCHIRLKSDEICSKKLKAVQLQEYAKRQLTPKDADAPKTKESLQITYP